MISKDIHSMTEEEHSRHLQRLTDDLRWMPNGKGGRPLSYKPVDVNSEEYQEFVNNPDNKHLIV